MFRIGRQHGSDGDRSAVISAPGTVSTTRICLWADPALTVTSEGREDIFRSRLGSIIRSLAIPVLLPAIAVGCVLYWPFLITYFQGWLSALPIAGGVIAIALATRFNRSRITLAATILLLTTFALLIGRRLPDATNTLLINLLAVLVPINFAALALFAERGFLTRWGLLRVLALVAQAAAVAWLCFEPNDYVNSTFSLQSAWLQPVGMATLPLVSVFAFAIALAVIGLRFVWRPRNVEAVLLGVTVAVFLTLSHIPQHFELDVLGNIYFAAGSLMLLLAILETSHDLAFRDELTGLPSRRSLDEHLMKLGSTFAIAMVDIDKFKKLNDRYGHDVGDQVLKMVAAQLDKVTGGGKAFRYGGEEFAIVFSGREPKEALDHAEALRARVAEAEFTLRGTGSQPRKKGKAGKAARKKAAADGKRLKVTVSIGLAGVGEKASTPEEVIKAADQALYRAKRGGRNCVRYTA